MVERYDVDALRDTTVFMDALEKFDCQNAGEPGKNGKKDIRTKIGATVLLWEPQYDDDETDVAFAIERYFVQGGAGV